MLLGDAQTIMKSICYSELPKLIRIQSMKLHNTESALYRTCIIQNTESALYIICIIQNTKTA